jgi:hypothetical protein
MATTRSNIHDDGLASNCTNPANLEVTITTLNERLAQMQKSVENLIAQNAALQAARNPKGPLRNQELPLRNLEQFHTPTIVPPIVNPVNKEENSHMYWSSTKRMRKSERPRRRIW